MGAVAALLLLGGPTLAFLVGKPYQLRQPARLAERQLTRAGLSLSLPRAAAERVQETPDGPTFVFGDVLSDPVSVAVFTVPLPPLDANEVAEQMATVQRSLKKPEGSTQSDAPVTFTRGFDAGLTVSYSFPSKLVLEVAFLFLPGKLVRLEVYRWPQLGEAARPGMARKLIETARPL
jgi:hypothetical protein